jgi:hypothetical protein
MMRFLSTKSHGVMDYLMAVTLIAAPWLLGFAEGGAETWVPVAVGVAMLGLALLTNYEMGAMKTVPMPVHLTIDLMSGLLLAASPWLFGFADRVYLPHLILGVAEIGASLVTQKIPAFHTDKNRATSTSRSAI